MKNLKRVFWFLFNGLTLILSYGLNLKLFGLVVLFWNQIYWFAFTRRFKKIGPGSFVEYPMVILGPQYIEIGNNFYSHARLRIEALDSDIGHVYRPEIAIADNVMLNFDCHIGCINKIIIGNNVLIGSQVFITDHSHGEIAQSSLRMPPGHRTLVSTGPVIIEDNVWIGEGVAILPNVRIGQNSIVGANAVVTKDVPRNSVVAGVPARVIRILE